MKISVITPTYNRKRMLPDTIKSVQESILLPYTRKDITIEHIIYDDGSTDGTEKLFQKRTWANVVYMREEANKGQSYGKNRAIERAKGDFIFILDSDDIILQRTLYYFIREIKRNPSLNFLIADFLHVDEKLKYLIGTDYYGWEFKTKEDILQSIFKGEHFIQNNTFFKKSVFIEVGGFDENLKMADDLDLYIRFLLKGYAPQYCAFISHLHRFHSDNLSRGVTLAHHLEDIASLKNKYHVSKLN